jgi:hypothetical protein
MFSKHLQDDAGCLRMFDPNCPATAKPCGKRTFAHTVTYCNSVGFVVVTAIVIACLFRSHFYCHYKGLCYGYCC